MWLLTIQIFVLVILVIAVFLLILYFPYPSPVIRRWLPAHKRWPEQQVRGWLSTNSVHPSYLRYFYRDPDRFPDSDTGLVSPADGLLKNSAVKDGVRYIVIALRFWDIHVQRSPFDGTVVSVQQTGDMHMDGEAKGFAFLREKNCPVQQRIVLDTAIGRIAVRLITSVAARRIEVWLNSGDSVRRGERIGRILLGSTVVLEVPEGYESLVPQGSRVWAGQTILVNTEGTAVV